VPDAPHPLRQTTLQIVVVFAQRILFLRNHRANNRPKPRNQKLPAHGFIPLRTHRLYTPHYKNIKKCIFPSSTARGYHNLLTTMTPPAIAFAREWEKNKSSSGVFKYLIRSNVVHHSSVRPNALTSHRRSCLYRMRAPVSLRTISAFSEVNLEPTKGRHSHYRIRTVADGKFLVFGTGNIILAGKKTHAGACASMTRMMHQLSILHKQPLWPVIHSSPNSVITGQLKHCISPSIKTELATTHSSKFPGIAISLVNTTGVTPEMYLRKGMIIIPGITSAAQLSTVVDELSALISPHLLPESTYCAEQSDPPPSAQTTVPPEQDT